MLLVTLEITRWTTQVCNFYHLFKPVESIFIRLFGEYLYNTKIRLKGEYLYWLPHKTVLNNISVVLFYTTLQAIIGVFQLLDPKSGFITETKVTTGFNM